MRIKQISLDILCFLILGLAVFFFAGGFAWDLAEDFFAFESPIEAVKGLVEGQVEGLVGLFIFISLYPLLVISAFATMAFFPGASPWLITRNLLSVLAML